FGDTVGFIYRDEGNIGVAEKLDILLLGQRLGCDIQQLGGTAGDIFFDLRDFFASDGGVDVVGDDIAFTAVPDGVNLVFHQGDERRYDDGRALHHEGGQLVAKRFATSGRHDDHTIAAGQYGFNDFFLIPFKLGKAKILLEGFLYIHHLLTHVGSDFLSIYQFFRVYLP